jgi:uncharacterized integral membrane protein
MLTMSENAQNTVTGSTHGRSREMSYRAGLVLQALGAAVLAVLYPIRSPFYSAGIMLFEVGVVFSAIAFPIRTAWIRSLVGTAVIAGIPLQIIGMFHAPPEMASTAILSGIGLVCLGAAVMAAKEAYCLAFTAGWLLSGFLPLVVTANLLGKENVIYNSLAFSLIFLLLLFLAGRQLKQPLASFRPESTQHP